VYLFMDARQQLPATATWLNKVRNVQPHRMFMVHTVLTRKPVLDQRALEAALHTMIPHPTGSRSSRDLATILMQQKNVQDIGEAFYPQEAVTLTRSYDQR
jgi:hypothetical protein